MHDPRVVVRKSGIEGTGYFASDPINEGEIVFTWEGKGVVSDDELRQIEAEGNYHSSVAIGENRNLLFNVVDPRSSERQIEKEGSGVGGLNHSCDPNLWMKDERSICARRDIDEDEELTIDYAMFTVVSAWKLTGCRCKSALCRRTITGNDWKIPELQDRYSGHFSPFINERITRLQPAS